MVLNYDDHIWVLSRFVMYHFHKIIEIGQQEGARNFVQLFFNSGPLCNVIKCTNEFLDHKIPFLIFHHISLCPFLYLSLHNYHIICSTGRSYRFCPIFFNSGPLWDVLSILQYVYKVWCRKSGDFTWLQYNNHSKICLDVF